MISTSSESGYYYLAQEAESDISLDIEHMHLQQPQHPQLQTQLQTQLQPPQPQQLQHLHRPQTRPTEHAFSLQHPFSHLYQTSTSPTSTPGSDSNSFASRAGLGTSEIESFYSAHPEHLGQNVSRPQTKQEQQDQGEHQMLQQQYTIDPNRAISHSDQLVSAIASAEQSATMSLTASALQSLLSQEHPLDLPSPPASSILDSDHAGRLANRRSLFTITPIDPSSSPSSSSPSSSASSSTASSPVSSNFDEAMLAMTGPPPITACASCKRSHIKCDSGRPCLNCLKHPSKAMTCRDAVPKPRGRPKGGSKAAAEALMLAKMQHPTSQPGLVPRPRVMSLPQQQQQMPHMPLQHQQPHHQQQRQPAYSSEPLHIVSRSSPTSPAAIEHRAIRSNRRPSLPTWHHPYAVTSPTTATVITSSAVSTYAPMVPGQLFFSSGETPEAYDMTPFPRPQSMSSLPSSTRSSFTSAPILTSMTTPDMFQSLNPSSLSMVPPPSLHQGLDGMHFLHQQPQQQQQQQQQHLSATGLLRSHSASSSLSPVALSSATGVCESMDMGVVEERDLDQEQHNMTALLENQRKVEAELQRMQHHQQLLLQQEHQKQQALVRLSMQQRKQQQHHPHHHHQLQFQLHQAKQQQQAQQKHLLQQPL
ncbi:unnamed protein product [Mortierella alpina]